MGWLGSWSVGEMLCQTPPSLLVVLVEFATPDKLSIAILTYLS